MYIAILGRQPNLSMAELESHFGPEKTSWFSANSSIVDTNDFQIEEFGGIVKSAKIIWQLPGGNWQKISKRIVDHYLEKWKAYDSKITLGISVYGFDVSAHEVQKTGLTIKKNLKKRDVSLRLIPNAEPLLNTATSHHNKLGLSPNKVELLIVRSESGAVIVAESTGSQNITALAQRDQARPKRDAFVGMLPPKLAQIMINLAGAEKFNSALWDPFCGTGVVLQEARLRGIDVYGSDLSDKMIRYAAENMEWLDSRYASKKVPNGWIDSWWSVFQADATTVQLDKSKKPPIGCVVSEAYLGQPFSAPPSDDKLNEVKRNVDHIITSFLKNIQPQLKAGTPLCLAVPAWRDEAGQFTHLPLIRSIEKLGYSRARFKHVDADSLIYYREDQVVARQLLVLTRA